jgi:hypothetical protein
MKIKLFPVIAGVLILSGILTPAVCHSQTQKAITKKYLTSLPSGRPENILSSYRMTAVYINRDLYGKFIDKTQVTGDYARGYEDGHMLWNNVFISHSDSSKNLFKNF